jgi:hypothetical protein
MTEAKRRDAWDRAAHLMAILANCHRGPKTKPFTAEQFHPFHQSESQKEKDRIPVKDWGVVVRTAWGL